MALIFIERTELAEHVSGLDQDSSKLLQESLKQQASHKGISEGHC